MQSIDMDETVCKGFTSQGEGKKKRKAKEGKILEWWRGDKVSGNLQASEAGLSQVANTSEVKLPQGRAISMKLMGLEL